ncbi:hypothetical protein JW979_11735 [bacterium]|nr:hypothetical protein [candidate division CSSED10-310 bacterium]
MNAEEFKFVIDLVEKLIKEEIRGQRFFSDASKYVRNPEAKALFNQLSIDENMHIEILEMEKKKLEDNMAKVSDQKLSLKQTAGTKTVEYNGEPMRVYDISPLNADEKLIQIEMPDLNLFKAEEFKELLENCSIKAIYKLAMRVEYDNFKYLVELSKTIPGHLAKRKILDIAENERDHFLELQRRFNRHR